MQTTDYEGQPVSAAVNLSLIENLEDREGRAYEEVTKKVVETAADGKAQATFVVKRLGYHEVEAWAKDAQGNVVYDSTRFQVVKEIEAEWPSLDLRADKDEYEPGDTAVITGQTSQPDGWVLITLEGSKIFRSLVVRPEDHEFTVKLQLSAEHEPFVEVHAAYREGWRPHLRQRRACPCPPDSKRLKVIITPDKEGYQPAETASYLITTRDNRGAGVPAEVGVGVVDASVYEIRPDTTTDAFEAWWGGRETRVETDFSLSEMYPGGAYQTMAPPAPAMEAALRAGKAESADEAAPRVRKFFTDTAYWGPSVVTGPDGSARVQFLVPDNLTTWRATARGLTRATQAGEERKDVIVTLPLLVRFTLPRFYVQGDEATAAATVHNYTGTERTVKVTLTAEGARFADPRGADHHAPRSGHQTADLEDPRHRPGQGALPGQRRRRAGRQGRHGDDAPGQGRRRGRGGRRERE